MEVSFILNRRDRKSSSIRAQIRFLGRLYTLATGVSCRIEDFKNGKCRSRTDQMRLQSIEAAVLNAVNYFEREFKIPTIQEFRSTASSFLHGMDIRQVAKMDKDFLAFVDRYIGECGKSLETVKGYRTVYNKLAQFFSGKYVSFNDIDLAFEKRFKKAMAEAGYSRNYIGTLIKNICVFMSVSHDIYKLHKNEDYKRFKVEAETADAIYLSMEELRKIHDLDITNELVKRFHPKSSDSSKYQKYERNIEDIRKTLTLAKNKFLIGALCAMRISDFNRIREKNVQDGKITIMPKKGSGLRKPEPISMPMHPIVREIISSGFDFSAQMPDQVLNRAIKEVCRMAGIDQTITKYITKGGELVEMEMPKYEAVSSHTARRFGATNMDLARMDRRIIQVCTGHKSMAMLEKYLKASIREVTAGKLENCGYFQNENPDEKQKILQYVRDTLERGEEPEWMKALKMEIS